MSTQLDYGAGSRIRTGDCGTNWVDYSSVSPEPRRRMAMTAMATMAMMAISVVRFMSIRDVPSRYIACGLVHSFGATGASVAVTGTPPVSESKFEFRTEMLLYGRPKLWNEFVIGDVIREWIPSG